MHRSRAQNSIIRYDNKPRVGWLVISLLSIAIIATGCRYTAAPADLLQKPAIAQDKERLLAAVVKALPKYSMLTLPQRDDNREAIRLVDMNGDGKEEAIVSYYNAYNTPEIMILRQSELGWRQSVLVEQPLARDIAWLKLIDLDRDGVKEMIVGWVGAFDSPNILELYSVQTKATRNEKGLLALKPIQTLPYSLAESGDLDGDGLHELAVISASITKGEDDIPAYRLSLYGWENGALEKRLDMALPQGVNAFEHMLIGRVSNRHTGIVLEGGAGAHSMLSYLYAWERRGLKLVYPDYTAGQDGFSWRPVVSEDSNGDGIIELQWIREAPETSEIPYSDLIMINEWMQWDGNSGFEKVGEQFLEYTYGVRLDIPEEWSGRYSMRKPPSSSYGIVTFDYWNEESGARGELATLYVVPVQQWGNVEAAWKEEQRPYLMIASNSGNVFLVSFAVEAPAHLSKEEKADFLQLKKIEPLFPSYMTIINDD